MAVPNQLSHLRDLLRSLKYMFAFASFVALASIIFLATVHSRINTAVLIGMVVCLGLLLTCAFFGWLALFQYPRLRFLYAGGGVVRRFTRASGVDDGRTMPGDMELASAPPACSPPSNDPAHLEAAPPTRAEAALMFTMERLSCHEQGGKRSSRPKERSEICVKAPQKRQSLW